MEVCRKLDNIKLENRPYTEVSIKVYFAFYYLWFCKSELVYRYG
jgi:hypothetical protein